MKKHDVVSLPVLLAVVPLCGVLTACVKTPVGDQRNSPLPPAENTTPAESAAPVENTQAPNKLIEETDLIIEDGRLASSSVNAVNLQAALDGYFAARSEAINEPNMAALSSVDSENSVFNAAISRANAIREFWEKEEVYIVSEETSFEIREITAGELPGTVDLALYEWTWVDYNHVGVDAPAGDRFGYGNDHNMTVSMNSDGSFSILKDSYEERDVSGHASADYDGTGACMAWE